MAAGSALAAYPAAQDLRLHGLAVGLGAFGLALLAGGLLTRSAAALGWSLAALGSEYAVWFAAQGSSLDEYTPLYAAIFLLVAELGHWSIERRVEAWSEPSLVLWRLGTLVVACGGAAAIAALVLVLAAAGGGGGAVLEALGAAAVIGALLVLASLVRRSDFAGEADAAEVDSRIQ
jgi:hypothetical protein